MKELSQMLTVLSGHTRDQGTWHRSKATRTLNQVTDSSGVAVIAGGVGAARFLRAIRLFDSSLRVTALVNTGDDTVVNGLHVSPDLDTVVYTLADAIDPRRGWGQRDESWTTMQSLHRYAAVREATSEAPNDWFNIGDRDLALHLYRTARLAEGARLSQVTKEIARAWNVPFDVVPMSDDRVATQVTLADDATSFDNRHYRRGETISFQEYFVRLRHDVAISHVEFAGIETAQPNGLDLLDSPRFVVIAPSNPIVSIGPIRALRGVNDALSRRRHSVVGISPIIGGAALKGPADRMLRELGMEPSAIGVARLYADVCGVFVIDRVDAELAPMIEQLGMRCIVAETVMSNDDTARQLAAHVIEAMS
jgi:LPPG:FO 2-phospho-L-lactate transferase